MLKVADLLCEYARNPLGLETRKPRFSWRLESEQRGTVQSAYRLLVTGSLDTLSAGDPLLWDSGRVASSQSVNVEYAGPPLASRQRCFWTVQAWDNHGREAATGDPAWFEIALKDPEDWAAGWIGSPAGWNGAGLLFRCRFDVVSPVVSARLYGVGLGYCEMRLNGLKVGDRVLEPDTTTFSKRVIYSVYDVTSLLQRGKNVVGAVAGNGWYGMTKLLLQLEITHTDGTKTAILTGGKPLMRWEVVTGPEISNSIYDGEVYDARRDREGWDTPEGEAIPPESRTDGWRGAVVVDPPGGRLVAQEQEPIRVTQTLRPVSISQPNSGAWVYDMGQNIAGWARLHVRGERGSRVTLRFAESLDADGSVNQGNLRSARCEDAYILKGGEIEEWEPRFTYHGFRYVQVEGYPGQPNLDSVAGRLVGTNMGRRGSFRCSAAILNQIQACIEWTERDNQPGIPTDCPQRDERMGWLNDMSARAEEAVYNFDTVRFFTKWLDDISDTQDPLSGAISDTAPFHWGHRPADPVCVCYLLLPWLLYVHYQDTRILRRHYAGMKKWVDCLAAMAKDDILEFSNWGDWSPPIHQPGQEKLGDSPFNANAPGRVISTGYLFYQARLLSLVASVLGNAGDRDAYGTLAQRIHERFNQEFWNGAVTGYGTGSQSCNSLALYFGLVPQNRQAQVVESLAREVEKHDGHLATGNVCTKYLLEALTDGGKPEVAYRIATQETYPSWGYMLANGATTIWERWEKATGGGMNSHNHPMFCSVSSWFYRALAGLRIDEDGAGFSHFSVRPSLIAGLDHAAAELNTVRGIVRTGWRRESGRIVLDVTVPPNSEALVAVPRLKSCDPTRVTVDGKLIWPNAVPPEAVPGILKVNSDGPDLLVLVGSGAYAFVSERSIDEK